MAVPRGKMSAAVCLMLACFGGHLVLKISQPKQHLRSNAGICKLSMVTEAVLALCRLTSSPDLAACGMCQVMRRQVKFTFKRADFCSVYQPFVFIRLADVCIICDYSHAHVCASISNGFGFLDLIFPSPWTSFLSYLFYLYSSFIWHFVI